MSELLSSLPEQSDPASVVVGNVLDGTNQSIPPQAQAQPLDVLPTKQISPSHLQEQLFGDTLDIEEEGPTSSVPSSDRDANPSTALLPTEEPSGHVGKEGAKEKRIRQRSEAKKQKELQQKIEREKREKELMAKYEGVLIIDKLYLGGRLAAQNYDWIIEKLGENAHILNVSSELKNYHSNTSFTYMKVPIADSMDADISKYFEGTSSFIDSALAKEASVLVHCREGKSRSVTIIIAYLMMKKGWTLEQAYKHILNIVPWKENINQGFKVQLMNLDLKREGKEELSLQFFDKRSRRKSSSANLNYCDMVKQQDEEEGDIDEDNGEDSSDASFDVSKEKKKAKRPKKINPEKQEKMKTREMESFETYWKILIGEQKAGKMQKAQDPTQTPAKQQDVVPVKVNTSTKKRKRSQSTDQGKSKKAKTGKTTKKKNLKDESEKENEKKKVKSPLPTPKTPTKKQTENFHTKDIMSYFLPLSKIQQ